MREKDIIGWIRARDERGAEALLRHYGALMRYIIAPILANAQDREECLSEAAARAWERIEQYAPERGSWCAWLTAIARNAALNRLRRDRNGPTQELPPDLPSPEPTPEEAVIRQESAAALIRALRRLSPGERALFYRKYYYLQPTAQIASELGMTERAVEGRLHRMRKRLRTMLGGEGYGQP